jgi:hypothetical protein
MNALSHTTILPSTGCTFVTTSQVQVANGQSSYVDFLICANVPDSDEEDNRMLVDADNNEYYQNDDANG